MNGPRRVLAFSASEARPADALVLRRAGWPPDRAPKEKVRVLLEAAVTLFAREAAPVALVEEVPREELLALLAEVPPARDGSSVGLVTAHSGAVALFAATVGEPVCGRIRTLFAGEDAPLGLFLDAVASEAASRLADLAAAAFRESLDRDGRGGAVPVLSYSPGYCGWSVLGQRALLARLAPAEIGISLGESGLMSPIKSVSGVLVEAGAGAHRAAAELDSCGSCEERSCDERVGRWTS